MRILVLHNRYKLGGGEDVSAVSEIDILSQAGHKVTYMEMDNFGINGFWDSCKTAVSATWNHHWYRKISQHLKENQYEIMHVHNFFPLISPSIYYAADHADIPVVQAVRNYRLSCPSANLFREGAPCQLCVGKTIKWPGVVNKCYRSSTLGSGAVAAMAGIHSVMGTWDKRVSRYIAVSSFVKDILVRDGFNADQISVKPNSVAINEDIELVPFSERKHVLYVGRLTEEKGIDLLIKAWKELDNDLPLYLAGEGPLLGDDTQNIKFLGPKNLTEVYQLMAHSKFVVMPGGWPEPFGRVAIEAFAHGTPMLAARAGGLQKIITPGLNGDLFEPGNISDLLSKIHSILKTDGPLEHMGTNARQEYLNHYTPSENLEQLEQIYQKVISQRISKRAIP